ncbi:imm11 family protein [Ensifer sp. MJa1]|uniref:imm11 family protein n=1 Tax=Ensifer sp. MJa1 TaxID=2919888 RepID=UPI0030083A57
MVYFLSHKNEEIYSYSMTALDGDVDKIRPVDLTRDVGVRVRAGYAYAGRPYEKEHVPTCIELEGPKRTITDIYSGYGLFVDEKFRLAVEKLEPNVHQFFPIDLVWKDGSHAAHRYWFVPCNRLDSVDRAKTTFEFRGLWDIFGGPDKLLVFSRSQIGSHHAWIDKYIHAPMPLISEALKAELEAAGVTGAHYNHFPETD